MATCTLTDYLPSISEVPSDRATAVRARLAAFVKTGWPDLDTAPNTPFGDLHLTPLAYQVSALEVAAERMFSDLDLANVAAGLIYNCDYVKSYIQNFAPTSRDSVKATGVIRLAFTSDVRRYVQRRTLFAFGAGNIFACRLAAIGDLEILPVGHPRTNPNQYVLTQFSRKSFVVDIPVIGIMSSAVSAGTAGTIDVDLPELSAITAVVDFLDGTRAGSIQALAQKTRQTFYAASLTSRGGAASFILREFPEVIAASAVLSGDYELLRDTNNALGVSTGSLDVYVRSKQAFVSDTQTIQLKFDQDLDKFVGKLDLAETPVKIDSVVYETAENVGLTYTIFSSTKDAKRAPLGSSAYSELEQLYIEVTMPRDENNQRLLLVEDGNSVGYFRVSYRFDPGLKQVQTALNSSDVRPVGVDVLAKMFIPVIIDSMTVEYVKKAGVQVNIEQARQEILTYMANLSYPEVYLDSAIGDAMMYAGATGVKRILVSARAQWSVASKFFDSSLMNPLEDWTSATEAAKSTPNLVIGNVQDMTPNYRDPLLGTSAETLVALGKRNISYILDATNLNFSEISL